jgi:uncharacterized membrane protein
MMDYTTLKWLHVLSATVLFGTGLGSAYYMFFASRTRDPRVVAAVVKNVVTADWLFTATTVVFQLVSGLYLVSMAGFALTTPWILWSIVLYFVAGACWLPVVWMQIRMRNIARKAVNDDTELPYRYWHYLRIWVLLGVIAFVSLVVVFYLMVAKPA